MHYVYLLRSISSPNQTYIGYTEDSKTRVKAHNSGASPRTAKYIPWTLVTYIAFENKPSAQAFEAYLKTGSGQAFSKKRLWNPPT